MNRTIKFRGKTIDTGEWVYSMTIANGTIKRKSRNVYMEIGNNQWKQVDEMTVGQFTGLLDKNGNEIYEGDVLKVDTGYDIHYTHIQFDCERGCWHRFVDYSIGVVVGNVFDNPELLGK